MSGPVSSRCSWRAVPGLAAALRVARQERSAGESSEPRAGEKFITLERVSEGGDEPPCFLYLQCDPRGKEEILSLTVISQARNMEIYAKEEEYVGTSRGEVYLAASDSGNGTVTFYRKFLKMESPTPACKVKLLSHGGKERLLLRNITVELTASTAQCPRSFPPLGTSIDLGRVQTMMDCMGCKLSPGAQQLLSMVQHQQKNLFPLGIQLQGLGCVCREGQLPGSGTAPRKGSSWTLPQADDFAALVSSVLEKQASGSSDLARTDLLPFLQNLCGQVNHMRIEERSAGHEPETRSEEHTMNLGNEQPACSYLESMVYKRLEHVEKKLLTHIDDRMDKLTEHMNDRMDRMMEHMDAQFAVLMSSLQNSHPSKLPQRQVNMGETLNRGEI